MRVFPFMTSCWFGLREWAADHHPRARIVAVLDFYHPVLDGDVGERVGVWRLKGERDEAYALRLGCHITEQQHELEALLQLVLNHRR